MSQRKAMVSIVIMAALFALGNCFLIHCLSVTSLFLLDVAEMVPMTSLLESASILYLS